MKVYPAQAGEITSIHLCLELQTGPCLAKDAMTSAAASAEASSRYMSS